MAKYAFKGINKIDFSDWSKYTAIFSPQAYSPG